ncbi:hypothetical protein PUN28_004196 [Cardiocondyla obscurior]|uniref:Uncharacterized protein n=1 Tax=Cardiocondyla obscurior TaxID=286306 RepID=A0AAW2GQ07_9HYME
MQTPQIACSEYSTWLDTSHSTSKTKHLTLDSSQRFKCQDQHNDQRNAVELSLHGNRRIQSRGKENARHCSTIEVVSQLHLHRYYRRFICPFT